MIRRPTSAISTALLLLTLPLAARQAAPAEGAPQAAGSSTPRNRALLGEIVERDPTGFQLRPWNPEQPRRVHVTASPETRYFEQKRSKPAEITVGEVVLVTSAATPKKGTPKKGVPKKGAGGTQDSSASGGEQESAGPARARMVLRLWNGEGAKSGAEDRQAARGLLRAAALFANGRMKAGKKKGDGEKPIVGVVTAVSPLTVDAAKKTVQFTTDKETVVVAHIPIQTEDLKRGQTVLVHSDLEPGKREEMNAQIIARCPRPKIGPNQTRQLILRENGRKQRAASTGSAPGR
jgi:hypothetical protein